MDLYNSLTNTVDEIEPTSDQIGLYSCGPTVYKNGHIGNLVSAIYADTLRRALEYGFPKNTVLHVMNFTDVDDKTIAQCKEMQANKDPMEGLKALTEDISQLVLEDYQAVGVDISRVKFVRATDHIQQMQDLILNLIDNKMAYTADDGIYFSIENYKKGKRYGQLVEVTEESTGAQRVDNDEYDKDQIHDFALWKKAKGGEPSWEFMVNGKDCSGRPGWHIECSAMSVEYLGQPFDIHTGGVDLKFPHHENEIAQSTATTDDPLARFFFHSEHLLIDGKKMAKSENNFFELRDIIKRGFDPLAFRLFVLQGHYQKQLNFSWEALEASQARLNSLRNLVELKYQVEQVPVADAKELFKPILNNLHTPKLLAQLEIDERQIDAYIGLLDQLLGLKLADITDAPKKVYDLITTRQNARRDSDFETSDSVRQELDELGYTLKDNVDKTYWQRKY